MGIRRTARRSPQRAGSYATAQGASRQQIGNAVCSILRSPSGAGGCVCRCGYPAVRTRRARDQCACRAVHARVPDGMCRSVSGIGWWVFCKIALTQRCYLRRLSCTRRVLPWRSPCHLRRRGGPLARLARRPHLRLVHWAAGHLRLYLRYRMCGRRCCAVATMHVSRRSARCAGRWLWHWRRCWRCPLC